MPIQIVKRRSRGFICVNAHPDGCRRNVERQITVASQAPPGPAAPRNVLVIGASTGYGLASRIAAAWGYEARTLGVFFERPPDDKQNGHGGLLQHVCVAGARQTDGLFVASINGDAFSDACKHERSPRPPRTRAARSNHLQLASPKRVHPARRGLQFDAQTIGESFSSRTIELDSEKVVTSPLSRD